jgi:hypothetical protein
MGNVGSGAITPGIIRGGRGRPTRQEIACDCTQRRGRKGAADVFENEGTSKSHRANNEGILDATGHELSVNSVAGTLPDDGALGKSWPALFGCVAAESADPVSEACRRHVNGISYRTLGLS